MSDEIPNVGDTVRLLNMGRMGQYFYEVTGYKRRHQLVQLKGLGDAEGIIGSAYLKDVHIIERATSDQ